MEVNRLAYLPIVWALWTIGGIITTYTLTIVHGHFDSYIMYISYTGCGSPERYVFFVVLTVAAFLDAMIKYEMYKQLSLRSMGIKHNYPWVQTFVLITGWIGCVGTVLVGVFPVDKDPVPHYFGAFMSFIFTAIHNTVRVVLLCRWSIGSRRMIYTRFSLCILLIISLVIFGMSDSKCGEVSTSSECYQMSNIIRIIAEWIGATFIMIYTLTHCVDSQLQWMRVTG